MSKKIFISYSHDSEEHKKQVLSISDRLRSDGLNCMIDQYINGFPKEGWLRWMEDQIDGACFVLIICTPLYLSRYKGKNNKDGRGVNFEGIIISQNLYHHHHQNTKFIPIIFDEGNFDDVPLPLRAYGTFQLPSEYDTLYRILTDQPGISTPTLGKVKELKSNAHPRENKFLKVLTKSSSRLNFLKKMFLSLVIFGLVAFLTPSCNKSDGDCSGIINGDINGSLSVNCN